MKLKTRKYIDEDDKQFSITDLKKALDEGKTIEDLIIEFHENEL